MQGVLTLTIVIGAYFLAEGVATIMYALEHPDIENITADNRSSHHWRRSIRPSPTPSSHGPK
jgi:hypothetical protein